MRSLVISESVPEWTLFGSRLPQTVLSALCQMLPCRLATKNAIVSNYQYALLKIMYTHDY